MMQLWLYTLASVFAVSAVALIGLFALSRAREQVERITPDLVSLAVGALLGGDGIHNLLDGVVIAASYAVDPGVGLVTTLAVFLHEVPQEVGDFGALVHDGLSPKRALLLNGVSALAALAGAVATLWLGTQMENVQRIILPIAAGNFLYIAASDLVPELHRERGGRMALWQVAIILAGIGLMLGIRVLREGLT